MFGFFSYNKNIRNIVVLFGTVFNDITIKRLKSDGTTEREFKVPIAYGPADKFLAKLNQPDVMTLPRMSFEITDYAYDPIRKLQTTKKFKKVKAGSTTELTTVFNPVPYDFNITLSVMVKYSDDGTQILEQILPYFTPEFQVTMNELSTMGIKRDIPIILNSVSTEDTYEGEFITRRALIHTLVFTVKGHIYGRTPDQGIIREVDVNIGSNLFRVGSVTITAGGSSYTSVPTVTFSGGGGSGATGTAVVSSNAVASITITNKGTGYSSAPTVTFIGGGGTGAVGTAVLISQKDVNIDIKPNPTTADADDTFGFTETITDL